MAFKTNYNHQRAERDRAKQAKKEAKLREKEQAKARAASGEPEPDSAVGADDAPEAADTEQAEPGHAEPDRA